MSQFQPERCCFCVHVYGEPALPSEAVSLHNAADENARGRQDGLRGLLKRTRTDHRCVVITDRRVLFYGLGKEKNPLFFSILKKAAGLT